MGRFILRYTGGSEKPGDVVEQVRGCPDVTILEESPRMLLVEGDEAPLKLIVEKLPNWTMVQERNIRELPDPRPKLKGTRHSAPVASRRHRRH